MGGRIVNTPQTHSESNLQTQLQPQSAILENTLESNKQVTTMEGGQIALHVSDAEKMLGQVKSQNPSQSPSQTPSESENLTESFKGGADYNEKDVKQTIKNIKKFKYDNLFPGRIFGKVGSHIQWWIGRIISFFMNISSNVMFFIVVLIGFVFMSVLIGVIDLGLTGVHGTMSFVSDLLKGLNVIAMGALSGPKKKVDEQNKKIPKNAIELIILVGIEFVTNPMPILNKLITIINGIKGSF